MGRPLTLLIIFGILGLGAWFMWQRQNDAMARQILVRDLADAKRDFAERAAAAAEEGDVEDYRGRILAALSSYENDLVNRVYKARPDWRDEEAYRHRLERQFQRRGVAANDRAPKYEGFEIVKGAYQVLKARRWKSVLTAAGAGQTRLDVYDLRRVRDDRGEPILEGRFFFWGLDDESVVNWGQLSLRYWHTVQKKTRRGGSRETEEVLGRAEGDATPHVFIKNPNDYIEEFPPDVSVGILWLPAMPRQATKVDIWLRYKAIKEGRTFDAELRWKKLPIPGAWQLAKDDAWNPGEVEATADEIAGRDDGTAEARP